jgi:hypothetical protein
MGRANLAEHGENEANDGAERKQRRSGGVSSPIVRQSGGLFCLALGTTQHVRM